MRYSQATAVLLFSWAAASIVPFEMGNAVAAFAPPSYPFVYSQKKSSRSLWLSSTNPNTDGNNVENERVVFDRLDASKFRHPLDRDLTETVQKLPGIQFLSDEILRKKVFPIVEQGARLDLLSKSIKVSTEQLPNLHRLLIEACEILDMAENVPQLYVQSNSQANAYTLAFQSKSDTTSSPIIVVTSALVDRCSEAEIQAVIAHELGHLKCEHGLYLTLGNIASLPIRNLIPPLPVVLIGRKGNKDDGSSNKDSGRIGIRGIGNTRSFVDRTLKDWRLAAEYTCDRASLLVAQDSNVVAGALIKLFAGTTNYDYTDDTNIEAFIAQCEEYDKLLKSANPLIRASVLQQQRDRTHPLPVRRVAELKRWADSDEYKDLLTEFQSKAETEEGEEQQTQEEEPQDEQGQEPEQNGEEEDAEIEQ